MSDKIPLAFFLGVLTHLISVSIVYVDKVKYSSYYFPVGLILAVISNFLWLYIAKNAGMKNDVYLNGLYWDAMIICSYTFIPIALFGVRLNAYTAIGAALIVTGFLVTKISG